MTGLMRLHMSAPYHLAAVAVPGRSSEGRRACHAQAEQQIVVRAAQAAAAAEQSEAQRVREEADALAVKVSPSP